MAREKEDVATADSGQPQVNYKVIGLEQSDNMPVLHGGKKYNLATISQENAEMLIKTGYPHLIKEG